MIVLAGVLIGGTLGALTAKKRGGSRLDMAQYAASSAIAFGLLGLVATIVIHRAAI